jgi:serine/threonine protein kinase/Flp pilus assembly protein TadD
MMSMEASKAAWLAPGCRLDRYDLLLRIAEGGMATLWLARQQGKHGFDKIVAIKTILPKFASDAGFQRMFLDEARVVSRIEHPNVAQVLDLGEERGVLFLVMEWVDGESLSNVGRAVEHKTHAQIPVGILTRVMVDVCAGLHAAHELTDDEGVALSVVHRDVSPDNLLVDFRGKTKVIDFGVAKARNRAAQETSIGILKGKIAYMAPEQAMGSGVDRRTDVWSAGASMYRFLAGTVPYSATEPLAVLRRILEGLPPPRLSMTVPEPIRFVVEKALEPDAVKRFETAHAMGAALETAMRAADIYTTREDVAAFMTEHLAETRAMRTREIEHAVRESRARMRVGIAHTEGPLGAALPIAQNDPIRGSPVLSAERAGESLGLESGSNRRSRPSRHPTAVLAGSQPSSGESRPSGYPTAVLAGSQPSSGVCDGPQTGPGEDIDAAGLDAGTRGSVAVPIASIMVPIRMHGRASRALVQWITGTCLLGVLVAAGFAWHAAQPSRPIAPADVAASAIRLPGPRETMLPSATSAVQATVPTPDPPAQVPASTRPKDQRAASTPLVGPSVPEQSSAHDLLERARHARRAGRLSDAAALFAAAVDKAPADSEALTLLAEVDEARGATAKAIVDYRRAVAVNPGYLPARLGLADALWTSGQRDEARIAYRSIVDEFPATLRPDLARERADGNGKNENTPK